MSEKLAMMWWFKCSIGQVQVVNFKSLFTKDREQRSKRVDPPLPSVVTAGATLGYSLKLVWSMGLPRESTALVCFLWYWKNKPVQPALGVGHLLWLPRWGGEEGQAGV